MFNPEASPQLLLSYVSVVILSFFLIAIGTQFVETISDRTTETHLGGGFVSGLYIGYDLDPDAMIIRELVDLTAIVDSSSLFFILSVLSILSALEILLGSLYIAEKRGKVGVLGCGLVILSGYLFPRVAEIGIILFLFGILFFTLSQESGF